MASRYQAPLYPGGTYHVFNHSVGREPLFPKADNRRYFLELYRRHVVPVADTFAYCLLGNHYHLLLRIKAQEELPPRHQEDPPRLHLPFSHWANAYTQALNKTLGRRGTLFERPFKRVAITSDSQWWTALAYIHLNPQRHGLVRDFRQWPHSSWFYLSGGACPQGEDLIGGVRRQAMWEQLNGVAGMEAYHAQRQQRLWELEWE